jgi:hypothetical protein
VPFYQYHVGQSCADFQGQYFEVGSHTIGMGAGRELGRRIRYGH